MVQSILAALLLGIVPLPVLPSGQVASLRTLSITPPAEQIAIAERLSASGVVVLDVAGGKRVYEKQGDVPRPMASLTKIMTALLIAENHSMDEVVTVPESATQVEGNRVYLQQGEQFTMGDLLSALLIASANDAAAVLAIHHSGSLPAFVEAMNARAHALGMKSTQYANPMGLDSAQQWATPQDLAWLTAFALRSPEIRLRMGQRGDRILSLGGRSLALTHTHALLHTHPPTVLAGKTGTTNVAKECLISLVESGGKTYIIVLLRSDARYRDTGLILDALQSVSPL
ncbi:MAG: serine hydrolase [Candidatus Peregrinibacteria bacterium]